MKSFCSKLLKIVVNLQQSLLKSFINNVLRRVIFPMSGGEQMFLSIKIEKQLLKNCRPICLFTICSKVLERLLYYSMVEFFTLISPNQPGFKTGDSCINQLISITHVKYKSFDDDRKFWPKTRLMSLWNYCHGNKSL